MEVLAKTLFLFFARFLFYDDRNNLMCEFSAQSTPQHMHSASAATHDIEANSSKQNMCSCLHYADPTNFNANELHKTGSGTFRVIIEVASIKFRTSIISLCIRCLWNMRCTMTVAVTSGITTVTTLHGTSSRAEFGACICCFLAWNTLRTLRWSWHVPPKRQVLSELYGVTTNLSLSLSIYLSIYGSTVPFFGPWPLLQFLNLIHSR
jgi:hypothetical protein